MKTFLLLLTIALPFSLDAQSFIKDGQPEKQIVVGADQYLKVKNQSGTDVFSWNVGGCIHDLSVLENGHILYANSDHAREVDTAKKIYWEYKPQNKNGGAIFGVERLKSGNTMVAENSTGRILIIDLKGKIVDSIQTLDFSAGNHQNLRLARCLDNGNYLVCHSGRNIVREYDSKGNVVWSQKTPQLAFCAERLKNGNTLISSLNQIQEYTKEGKVVWQFKANDVKEYTIRNMTGFKVLPNGNILIGCYMPHIKNSPAQSMFEITHDKKVLWHYSEPTRENSIMALDYVK